MKLKFFHLLLLSFYIVNCTFYIEAQATVRYVSKTGNSQPPYTSWETSADSIQKCINICSFGDTVYVANGVYKERIDMIAGLALIGVGMDSCVIDTREFIYVSGFYSIKLADSCLVSGLHIITYDENHGDGFYIREQPGITINSIIFNNKIEQAAYGIYFSGFSTTNSSVLIYKNWILNVETGIVCMLNSPRVLENIIYPKEIGLVSDINSSPAYLKNTIILENGSNASYGYGPGFHLGSVLKDNSFYIYQGNVGIYSANDSVINNVVTGNPTYGMWTQSNGVVENNIVKGANTGIRQMAGTTTIKYNNLWENNTNYVSISPDTTNIYVNPMFVNEDSLNLHLQMYSPLIDAGDPNIIDKDGSRSDIGIYGGPFGESYKYQDLAPSPPLNLTAKVDSNFITLNWNRNTEADTSFYNVYRDTLINFTVDSTKLISSLSDTFFVQINPHNVAKYVYKITCVDNQGNESEPSEEVVVDITSVSIDDYPMTISDYQLYQNYPNPFNPSTTISYRLKERGYVKLYVYDIKGELVSTLVNKNQDAGFYQVDFSLPSIQNQGSSIQHLASGIYIYQIMIRSERDIPVFADMKKMIYLK